MEILLIIPACFIAFIIFSIYHSIFDVTYFGCGGCLTEIFFCLFLGIGITITIAEWLMKYWYAILIIGVIILIFFYVLHDSDNNDESENIDIKMVWEPFYDGNNEISGHKIITTITNNGDSELKEYKIYFDVVFKDDTVKTYQIQGKNAILPKIHTKQVNILNEKEIADIINIKLK